MVAITRESGKSINLEDFRQVEDEANNLPLPAQLYPITITVEILINGVWTDISMYVYQRSDIVITAGQGVEDSGTRSAQCTMTLNNRDGRFSPAYISGQFYPYLQRNTPIRVWVTATSITGYYYSGIRFMGFVAKWPPQADTSQQDVWVNITANGPIRQTNQGGGKGSALARYYSLLQPPYDPIAYWPCEEDFGTNEIGPGIEGGQAMTISGGAPVWKAISSFNGSAPIGVPNNSTWTGQTASTNQGSGDDLYPNIGTYFWTAPPGITSVTGQAVGGGGGGYGSDGGGGGGGEYSSDTIAVTPGNSYKVVVGGPGGKGNPGSNSTFFGDSNGITAHGGGGASGNTGGSGGTGSSAATHHNGGAGANQQPSGTQISLVLTATGLGSWTAPTGVTSVKVECYGAGGGGSNGGVIEPFPSGGGGGGGGEYASQTVSVTPGNAYAYAVGAGGAGGGYSNANHQYGGSNGGATAFNYIGNNNFQVVANGGEGAFYQGGTLFGGNGGSGSTNTVHHNGGAGNLATGISGNGGGGGGSCASSTSAGNNGSAQSGSTGGSGGGATSGSGVGDPGGAGGTGGNSSGGGQNGSGPGGGGGGGGQGSGAQFHQGGSGSHGKLVLTYTPNVPSGGGGGGSGGSGSAGNSATTAAGAAAVTYGGPGGNGGAQVAGTSPVTGPGGGGGGSGGGAGGANGAGGQVEITYTPVDVPNAAVIRNIVAIPSYGGNASKVLHSIAMSGGLARIDVIYIFGGNFQIKGYDGSNDLLFTSSNLICEADGATLMLSVELTNSGSSLKYALRAIKPGATSILASVTGTLASTQVGNVTSVTVAPNGDITKTGLGHYSVQYALADLTLVSKALDGHSGEMTIERFLRLANEQAIDNCPQFRENLDHWGFEADLQGWQASNGSLSRTSSWASEGKYSLVLTATGEGFPTCFSPQGLNGTACNPGDIVSVNCDVSSQQGLAEAYIGIRFWKGDGTPSAVTPEIDGTAQLILSDANQLVDPQTVLPIKPKLEVTGQVPSDATLYSVVVGDAFADSHGTIMRIDNVRAQPRMGAQTRKEFKHFLEEIKHLDQAIIRETHFDYNPFTGLPVVQPGIWMRTRWTLFLQQPVLTLDYSQGQCYGTLAPVIDDKLTKNDITVHRYKGSKVVVTLDDGSQMSFSSIGKYKKYLKVIAERDEQLVKLANLLLNLGTNPYERYPTIEFNFARPEVANLIGLAAAVEIGDFIQINNLAFWYPSTTVKQLVQGYQENINAYNWDIVWNCNPESPFEISVQDVGWY